MSEAGPLNGPFSPALNGCVGGRAWRINSRKELSSQGGNVLNIGESGWASRGSCSGVFSFKKRSGNFLEAGALVGGVCAKPGVSPDFGDDGLVRSNEVAYRAEPSFGLPGGADFTRGRFST